MVGSLFLSIIFHSFIILVFLFGSDFLGFKKKIKLTDIPIEVVEIAKKSEAVSKKIEKKKSQLKKRLNTNLPKLLKSQNHQNFQKLKKENFGKTTPKGKKKI